MISIKKIRAMTTEAIDSRSFHDREFVKTSSIGVTVGIVILSLVIPFMIMMMMLNITNLWLGVETVSYTITN